MSTRILVTGSRGWTDEAIIYRALVEAWDRTGRDPDAVLVHGACHLGGADIIARDIWRSWGLPDEPHPAERDASGRLLGPQRNARMVNLGADVCLAFPLPGSRGTRNCMRLAREAAIPVREYAAHDCTKCAECVHDGHKCCGCYDGACCRGDA